MKRNEIIAEINGRGYVAQATTAIKNGIEKEAISIRQHSEDKVAVNLYPADFTGSATEIAEEMIALYQRSNCDFDLSVFSDKEYILSHVRLGLQAKGTEEIVKRPSNFEGLEEYLYISGNRGEEHFSVKIKKEMLVNADVALNVAWSVAEKNNHKYVTIKPLTSVIANIMGEENICDEFSPIYVVSNTNNFRGASAIADRRALKQLADSIGIHSFYVLCISIHECILVPQDGKTDISVYENMVKDINGSGIISPEDKLIDRAYAITA